MMQLGDKQPFRILIHDRDANFSHAFDEVFWSEAIKVIRTPVQAPNANAHAERWVRSLSRQRTETSVTHDKFHTLSGEFQRTKRPKLRSRLRAAGVLLPRRARIRHACAD
jgi:hypothetical protein